jgi:hypothetical protein
MTQFRVRWEIDVEAESETGAAIRALEIHRNPDSIATVFDVQPVDGCGLGPFMRVDLTEGTCVEVRR